MKDSGRLLCMLGHLCLRPEGPTRYSAEQAHLGQAVNRRGLEVLAAHRQKCGCRAEGPRVNSLECSQLGSGCIRCPPCLISIVHSVIQQTPRSIHVPCSVVLLLQGASLVQGKGHGRQSLQDI